VKAARILVVDDDTAMREMMALALGKEGFEVRTAATADEAREAFESTNFDVIVTDIYLGDGTGIELLEHSGEACPDARVILVTAHGTVETAASARRLGVFDYLAKPFEVETLVTRVHAAMQAAPGGGAEVELGPESMIVGNDPSIVEVYNAVARVAPLPIPVLLHGETGTGKELIARALHRFGANPEAPFVPLNCGAIPENLLESELFGHRRGSFTGADRDHRGAIEAARGGTLFLDEVGELPAALQVKLLRFLQSGEVRPVGAESAVQVPVRIVAATNRDLRAEVDAGAFREDFFYRLSAYEIEARSRPPARQRQGHCGARGAPVARQRARTRARRAAGDRRQRLPGRPGKRAPTVDRKRRGAGAGQVSASHRGRAKPRGAREAPHRSGAAPLRRKSNTGGRDPRHRTEILVPKGQTSGNRPRRRGGGIMRWSIGTVALLLTALPFVFAAEAPANLEYDVVSVKRHLFLETSDGEKAVHAGERVRSGDVLRTGSRSKTELAAPAFAARFVVGSKTRFSLAHEQPGVLLEIQRGSLRAIFGTLGEGDQRERLVTTPSAVLAVRGTEYGLEVEKDGDTSVAVFEGIVEVWEAAGVGERVRVQAGESTRVRRGKAPSRPMLHGLSPGDWDQRRRRPGQSMGGAQQGPGTSMGGPQGSGGSRSSGSQGGSKRRGG
jgi:CheY-like chemotaxis protein